MSEQNKFYGFDAKVRKDRVLTLPSHIWDKYKPNPGDVFHIESWELIHNPKEKKSDKK